MLPKQPFGRTGHASSRLIFGSYAISQATQLEADQVLDLLLENGINHIDTAPLYGNAEKLVGSWMKRYRGDFFLATKSRCRSYRGAWEDLQRSLQLLNVDYIDLWQMHGLTNPVGWEKAMGPDGALKAFIEARDKGLVRFLGVTGHGNHAARMHLRSLERFGFDSVLLPYNYCQMRDPRYANDFGSLKNLCRERIVAIQTIKSIARRPWGDRPKNYNTYFYEPLDTQSAIDKAVHWVLGTPDIFLITAGDLQLLPMVINAAVRFETSPPDEEISELMKAYEIQPVFS